MGRLENKVAFITGAARGQGRAHAVRMAEEGADIIAVDLCEPLDTVYYDMPGEQELEETVRLVEGQDRRIIARKAGRARRQGREGRRRRGRRRTRPPGFHRRQCRRVEHRPVAGHHREELGRCGRHQPAERLPDGESRDRPHPCARRRWRERARELGGQPARLRGLAHYASAKHGVVGLMRVLAVEFGPQKIRVNSTHPTPVTTPMLMNSYGYGLFGPDKDEPTIDASAPVSQSMHTLPVPWVKAVDIANAAVFLCSDEARYITGATLPVDAGADLIA